MGFKPISKGGFKPPAPDLPKQNYVASRKKGLVAVAILALFFPIVIVTQALPLDHHC